MKRRLVALAAMLALLAQGIGGASASAGMHAPASKIPAVAAEAALPCHGEPDQAPQVQAPTPGAPCDCCEASCALACAFVAIGFTAPATPALFHAASPQASGHAPRLLAAHTASPFRPPAA